MKGDPKTSILENMFCQNGGWEKWGLGWRAGGVGYFFIKMSSVIVVVIVLCCGLFCVA